MEKTVFDHKQDNVFEACSVNEKKFKEKVKSYNKKMGDEGLETDKASQRVEILCDMFTKEELAILFVSSQRAAGIRSSLSKLFSEALT